MISITRLGLTVIFFALSFNVSAGKIDVSGYASLIGTNTDQKNVTYWNEFANQYTDFTHQSHIGLQFNTDIVKNLEFSLTLLGEGKTEYQTRTAWFYATYEVSDNTSFRFGRLKVPFFMVSNYIDIGHAYPWVSPPADVYTTNVIESADGLEYIYETSLFGSSFQFNTYVGSNSHQHHLSPTYINDGTVNTKPYVTGDKIKFEAHELFGVVFSISTDSVTFKMSHNQAVFTSDELGIEKARISIGGFGFIVDWNNFLLYSEFSHRDTEASLQAIMPDQNSKYITLGYRIGNFLPYITQASITKGKSQSKYALVQDSSSIGIRYDINPKMDIKFQATKIKPGLSGDGNRYGLFDGAIAENKEPNVYSMSVDILF